MSQNNKQTSQPAKFNLDEESVKALILQQGQKLQIEEKKLLIEQQRIVNDGKLAEKAMAHNAELLKNAPKDQRKLIVTVSVAIFVLILIILGFLGFCLYAGKDEFVKDFVGFMKYLFSAGIGVLVGRATKKGQSNSNKQSEIEDAEVLNE